MMENILFLQIGNHENWNVLGHRRHTGDSAPVTGPGSKAPALHPESVQPLLCQQKQPRLCKQQRELLRLLAEQAAEKEKNGLQLSAKRTFVMHEKSPLILSIFRGNYKTEEKEKQNNICENTETDKQEERNFYMQCSEQRLKAITGKSEV